MGAPAHTPRIDAFSARPDKEMIGRAASGAFVISCKVWMLIVGERPLLALGGHHSPSSECPLSGVKRTSNTALVSMSAFDPKRSRRVLVVHIMQKLLSFTPVASYLANRWFRGGTP